MSPTILGFVVQLLGVFRFGRCTTTGGDIKKNSFAASLVHGASIMVEAKPSRCLKIISTSSVLNKKSFAQAERTNSIFEESKSEGDL